MDRSIMRFTLVLSLVLLIVFGLHLFFLRYKNLPLFDHKMALAYIVNYTLALSTYITLYKLKEKLKNQLGFLFMASSFLKFILFFAIFYPDYSSDQKMSTLEFSTFFIPYLTCLSIEVFALTRMLNKLN